jgi:hypothetical protein
MQCVSRLDERMYSSPNFQNQLFAALRTPWAAFAKLFESIKVKKKASNPKENSLRNNDRSITEAQTRNMCSFRAVLFNTLHLVSLCFISECYLILPSDLSLSRCIRVVLLHVGFPGCAVSAVLDFILFCRFSCHTDIRRQVIP